MKAQTHRDFPRRALRDDRGAGLVEFALALPLLLLLIFGIIEASWAFAQQNDIRHGTREGARLAAVDYGDVQTIALEICDRMDVVRDNQSPTLTLTPITANGTLGGQAEIDVTANMQTLTGALDWAFGSMNLSSSLEFRLEQPIVGEAQWWANGAGGTFTCS